MADLQTSTAHHSADIPSTSTSISTTYHDVFINHRGPDVKTGFATDLYRRLLSHRLQPFLDKEELQKGKEIDPQIEGAIRTASIHIVIFSPGYAESPWCLKELLLILNKSRDTVIPVFYKVKPSHVRWATKDGDGQYARALNILEKKERCDPETLEKWRAALYQASNIVGFELKAYNGDEAKLLEEVVGCVLKNRGKTPLHVATHPTGVQEKVDDFEKTLLSQQQNSGKARVLGIVGMGGAGKTTLAKEFFNGKSKLLTGLTQRTDQIDSMDDGIEILRRESSSTGPVPHHCSHCGHACHGPTQEPARESYLQHLFSVESPSLRWEDVGHFDLDEAMAAAKDTAAPYIQVSAAASDQPSPPGINGSPSVQVRAHRHVGVIISPPTVFVPPYMPGVAPGIHVPFPTPFPNPFHPAFASHPPPHFHPAFPSSSQPSLTPLRPTHPPPSLQFPMFPPSPLRPRYTIPPQHHRPQPPPPYSSTILVSPSRVAHSILQPVGVYRPRSLLRPLHSTLHSTTSSSLTVPPSFVANIDVAASSVMPSTLASEKVVQPTAPPASPENQPVVFTGGISERLGSRRRTTPSRISVSSEPKGRWSKPPEGPSFL